MKILAISSTVFNAIECLRKIGVCVDVVDNIDDINLSDYDAVIYNIHDSKVNIDKIQIPTFAISNICDMCPLQDSCAGQLVVVYKDIKYTLDNIDKFKELVENEIDRENTHKRSRYIASNISLFITIMLAAIVIVYGMSIRNDIIDHDANSKRALAMSSILQHAESAYIVLDDEMNIIVWNDYATTLFGWEENEILGLNIVSVLPNGIDCNKFGVYQTDAINKNGDIVKVIVYSYIAKNGETYFILLINRR